MDTIQKYATSFIIAAAVALTLTACGGHKYKLNPSMTVPAATGTVQAGHDKNGNTTVDLKVRHLAKPANLTPSRVVYVVWIQRPGMGPENQGQLQVGDNLEGEFKTTVPYNNFEIFVTAEDNPHTSVPSGQEVLRQRVTP